MAIIRNIKLFREIIRKGDLRGGNIDLPPHIKQLSSIIPIHISAIEALKLNSISTFLAGQNIRELKHIKNWDMIPESFAKPFRDVNLEIKTINIIKGGNVITAMVLADKNADLSGNKIRMIVKGNEYEFNLSVSYQMNKTLNGRPNTVGYGMGKAIIVDRPDLSKIKAEQLSPEDIDSEVSEYLKAIDLAKKRSEESHDNIPVDSDLRRLFLVLNNFVPELNSSVIDLIRKNRFNTKMAVDAAIAPWIKRQSDISNKETKKISDREKAKDLANLLKYMKESIIKFRYEVRDNVIHDIQRCKEDVVVVSSELSPNDAAHLIGNEKIKGVVLERGTRTDHTIIILKNAGIPVAYGVKDVSAIREGQTVIVDGVLGRAVANPDEMMKAEYFTRKSEFVDIKKFLADTDRMEITRTTDGKEIHFSVNVDDVHDVKNMKGAYHGIGLLRTETFYMENAGEDRDKEPSVTEIQNFMAEIADDINKLSLSLNGNENYQKIKRQVNLEVVARTIDLGEDKQLEYVKKVNGESMMIGRGLSLCLNEPTIRDIFIREIKGILLASNTYKNIKIMFPMVESVEELSEGRKVVQQVMERLDEDKLPFNREMEIGAMIETEKAVKNVDAIAGSGLANFLSIGSNDLTQYITQGSRYKDDPAISGKYDEFDPRVITALKTIIEVGRKYNMPVSLCGDLASNPLATFMLLGMGLEKFSMDLSSVDMIRHIVRNTSCSVCEELTSEIGRLQTAQEIRGFTRDFVITRINNGTWPGLASNELFKNALTSILRRESGEI